MLSEVPTNVSLGRSGHRGFHASTLVSEAPRLPGWTASCVSGESKQTSGFQCTRSKAFLNCSRIHTYPSPQPCQDFLISFLPSSACLHLFPHFSNLPFPFQVASICSCVSMALLPHGSLRNPSSACHCSALCATLACFVNNHLFVAGIVAAITSDLPVSSIMDRLLDVNICKSLLLDSPPGWD